MTKFGCDPETQTPPAHRLTYGAEPSAHASTALTSPHGDGPGPHPKFSLPLTAEQRAELRLLVSEKKRQELGAAATVCPRTLGTRSGYRRGCRCRDCTYAETSSRAKRRHALRALTTGDAEA